MSVINQAANLIETLKYVVSGNEVGQSAYEELFPYAEIPSTENELPDAVKLSANQLQDLGRMIIDTQSDPWARERSQKVYALETHNGGIICAGSHINIGTSYNVYNASSLSYPLWKGAGILAKSHTHFFNGEISVADICMARNSEALISLIGCRSYVFAFLKSQAALLPETRIEVISSLAKEMSQTDQWKNSETVRSSAILGMTKALRLGLYVSPFQLYEAGRNFVNGLCFQKIDIDNLGYFLKKKIHLLG